MSKRLEAKDSLLDDFFEKHGREMTEPEQTKYITEDAIQCRMEAMNDRAKEGYGIERGE